MIHFKKWWLVLMVSTSIVSQCQALPAIPKDNQQHHLETAAHQGDAQAQFNLGLMYEQGKGVNRNFIKAFKWYLKSDKLLK